MARWTVLIVLRRIPIGHPLPYVPRHVIGPIRTLASLIAPNRSRRAIAVIDRVVFPFERTVAVAEICPGAVELVPPGIQTSIRAAGGFFPLGFGLTGCEFCKSFEPLDVGEEHQCLDGPGISGAHGQKKLRARTFPSHIHPGVPRIFLTAPLSYAAIGLPHDRGEKLLATENSQPVLYEVRSSG